MRKTSIRLVMTAATIAAIASTLVAAPPATAATAHVVLNEIACEGTDQVELANTGDAAADLSGWLLTDKVLSSTDATHRYLFASGTSLAPGAHLVVEKAIGGFPFGISCGDDTIRLADSTASAVDDVVLPDNAADPSLTYGRLPDGTGDWTWTMPTVGAANQPTPDDGASLPADPAWLYDPLAVNEIDFAISPAGLTSLAAWPTSYVDATMTVTPSGGEPVTLAVGVRLKGSTSFRTLDGKAALKVKVNHSVSGQRLSGLRGLTLNNMVQDRSMIAEAVSARVFSDLGVPSARVGYAFVRINGAAYGLYANVETVNEDFAASRFPSTLHVYEASQPGTDISPGSLDLFETEAGPSADTADLLALIAAADTASAGWLAAVSPRIDLAAIVRVWAAEHIASHWDSYSGGGPNNYYLHSDSSGRFTEIPSGTDQTWSTNPLPFGHAGRGRLFTSCVADATCRQAYVDALTAARPTVQAATWSDLAASIAAVLVPWQAMDPRKEYTTGDIAESVSLKRQAISARGAQLSAWLSTPTFDAPSGGGAGGGGAGGGGSGGGDGGAVEPVTVAQVIAPAAASSVEPTAPLPATIPASVRPALTVAPRGARGALVVVRPGLSARPATAPVQRVATGRLVRLKLGPVPAAGSLTVDVLVDGTWRSIGSATRTAGARATTRAFRLDVPGTYPLRIRTSDAVRYLRLQVSG